MTNRVFIPADILLPSGADMEKWSVVACDQFTSQPEYWDRVNALVGGAPSTLRLILPEAWLETERAHPDIAAKMREYIGDGLFSVLENSYIYVERTLSDGSIRKGLLGAFDLEAYDYHPHSSTPIRATEGTVESRLPARVALRRGAPLELPHIMVFIDDPEKTVIEAAGEQLSHAAPIYDFQLMEGGGRIVGKQVSGEAAAFVEARLAGLGEPQVLERKYGRPDLPPVIYAVGDGNHSLAAAKLHWDSVKAGLSADEQTSHPARYALAELVNIHDDAICFEPIHRVVFNTNTRGFVQAASDCFASLCRDGSAQTVVFTAGDERVEVKATGLSEGETVSAADRFIAQWIAVHGGSVDYVHGDDTAADMAAREGCAAILLPKLKKDAFFATLMSGGVFPKKSFSVGAAEEKRYYLECRSIVRP